GRVVEIVAAEVEARVEVARSERRFPLLGVEALLTDGDADLLPGGGDVVRGGAIRDWHVAGDEGHLEVLEAGYGEQALGLGAGSREVVRESRQPGHLRLGRRHGEARPHDPADEFR